MAELRHSTPPYADQFVEETDAQSNPLALPAFDGLAATRAEEVTLPQRTPSTAIALQDQIDDDDNDGSLPRSSLMPLVYSSSADEQDYMIFRCQWGRLILSPALCFGGALV